MIIKLEFISYLFYNRYSFDNNKKLLCGSDELIAKNIFYDVSKLREKIDENDKNIFIFCELLYLKHINHTQHIAIIERAKNKIIKHKTQIGKTFSRVRF